MRPAMTEASRRALQLVCYAATSLYLELALIRLLGAEVLYLGYFSNFVLISAFVGLGLGFLAAKRQLDLAKYFPVILLFLVALVHVADFDADALLESGGNLMFFSNVRGQAALPGALLLAVLFVSTAALFATLGSLIGRLFVGFAPLTAYTLDIAGSLAGILIFTVQNAGSAGPLLWLTTGILLLMLGYLLDPEGRRPALVHLVFLALAIGLLLQASTAIDEDVRWSRYQKLEVRLRDGLHRVHANGIEHQMMKPASTTHYTFYGLPYRFFFEANSKDPESALIIGAGSGTDVATALSFNVQHIDAVEIDPEIVEIGSTYHPDQPYQNPAVNVVATDGRVFIRNSDKTYDVIVFALPDSLVRLASAGDVRLESYLFTVEAFREVRARLAPGGVFALYNQVRQPWLVDRIAAMLEEAFGTAPHVMELAGPTWTLAMGTVRTPHPIDRAEFTGLARDDWPFLYMRSPGVHWGYLGMLVVFLLAALLGVHFLAPPGTLRTPDVPFFLMGVAFLLLETKSVAFFSLLFGTTWMVNAMAFAGILMSVLVANLWVARSPLRRNQVAILLFAAIAIAYFTPSAALLSVEHTLVRYVLSAVLVFSPIFFANLLFSREFKSSTDPATTFGWNLLGAVAGGAIEYASMWVGHKNLLWIVALAYAGALLWLTRRGKAKA
jgi:spermidine synthase